MFIVSLQISTSDHLVHPPHVAKIYWWYNTDNAMTSGAVTPLYGIDILIKTYPHQSVNPLLINI